MTDYRSPLLSLDGAVEATGVDSGTAWHYGDPLGEQRRAGTGCGLFDQSHRDVLVVTGPDRLEWLHAICSQHVLNLRDGQSTEALVLSVNGHVEQHWVMTELADQIWIDTEPGDGDAALAYLLKMRFLKRVQPQLVTTEWAVLSLLGPDASRVCRQSGLGDNGFGDLGASPERASALAGGGLLRHRPDGGLDLVLPRPALAQVAGRLIEAGAEPIGSWGAAALRVQARLPRLGVDTDHRTLAHEAGWIGQAVHLDKGCYRGQETVARVQNMGKPPRRIVLLHLGGESDRLPAAGTAIERAGRTIGVLGTAVHHYELGPIALGLVKRTAGPGDELSVAGNSAAIDRSDEPGSELVEGFAGRLGVSHSSA